VAFNYELEGLADEQSLGQRICVSSLKFKIFNAHHIKMLKLFALLARMNHYVPASTIHCDLSLMFKKFIVLKLFLKKSENLRKLAHFWTFSEIEN
jgi:hypothetical protein